MDHRIKNVVIVGGGTAGWMSAAYLGRALHGNVRITVLEAPTVPRIGVGEATVPNLHRVFFNYLGFSEDEWMRECNASFKTAVKFINWRTPGEGQPEPRQHNGRPDQFYHPFGLLPEQDNVPLSHYWANKRLAGLTEEPFDYSCFVEPAMMDAKLAPRYRDGRPATRYAWHFDAHGLADFLCRFATTKQGAVHIADELTEVIRDERGFITELRTKAGRTIQGDLFVDCTGFRGLLINQAMEEPFLDMSNLLINNSAVATSVPHDDERYGVGPYTSAIAMSSGWSWRIPMLSRFGSGYVYSSDFATRDQATEEFCRLWGLDPEHTPLNHIRFRVGRNRRAWVKNCVGIGLASCFLEPLESTGIYFTYAALYQLAKHFPDTRFDPVLIDRFNHEIETMFDDTRDFIQAHFYYAPRTDTPYWRANKELQLASEFKEKVATYRAGLAVNQPVTDEQNYYGNFDAEFRNFWTNGSYFSLLAGMGVEPEHPLPVLAHRPASVQAAEQLFADVQSRQRELVAQLPTNLEVLKKLHAG